LTRRGAKSGVGCKDSGIKNGVTGPVLEGFHDEGKRVVGFLIGKGELHIDRMNRAQIICNFIEIRRFFFMGRWSSEYVERCEVDMDSY
jgi:hypothetical protein